jgi:Carboxypeptidase regulatory-like domain
MTGRVPGTWWALALTAVFLGAFGVAAGAKRSSSIKGRVFRSDTGQAVSGATVQLLRSGHSEERDGLVSRTTDLEGRYQFAAVEEGEYSVAVEATYERQADAPCKLQVGRNEDARGIVFTNHSGGHFRVRLSVSGVKIKGRKGIVQDFNLVCDYWIVAGP